MRDSGSDNDTIAAIATAAGAGGIGIVRLSGARARAIAQAVCNRSLRPRHAQHARFCERGGDTIDDGIALYFAAPASYTGEDVSNCRRTAARSCCNNCSHVVANWAHGWRDQANIANVRSATASSTSPRPKRSPT